MRCRWSMALACQGKSVFLPSLRDSVPLYEAYQGLTPRAFICRRFRGWGFGGPCIPEMGLVFFWEAGFCCLLAAEIPILEVFDSISG
jgi:hypothetical protein